MNLVLHQLRGEQRLYWRSHELAFFTFLFPVIIFVLLGSVYGSDRIKDEGVKGSAYLLAGILGYGVASTAFAGLAIVLVIRRESGILKRLRGTPLPAHSYVAAFLASTIIVFAIEAATLILLARVLFGVPFPERFDLGMGTTIVVAVVAIVSAFYLPRPLMALIRAATAVVSGRP